MENRTLRSVQQEWDLDTVYVAMTTAMEFT